MTHTSKMKRYAVVYGRIVQFFKRERIDEKRYSRPVYAGQKHCRNKAEAMQAKMEWEAA